MSILARFAFLDEDYQAALRALDQALALDRDNAELIELKLRVLQKTDGPDQALKYLRQLWRRDQARYAYLRFEAGYIRLKAKQYDKALIHFRHAEEVDRERAIQEQAQTYLDMQDYDKASSTLERLSRQSADSWHLRAQILSGKKDYDQARQALKNGLAAASTPEETQALKAMLANIAAVEKSERPWRIYTSLVAQYEDNVFRDPLQSSPAFQPTRKKGDFSWLAKLDMDYLLGRGDQTAWGLTSQLQTINYAQLRDANYSSWSMGAYWEYQGKDWGFRLPYEFAYYLAKGDLIRKVRLNSLTPTLRLQHDQNWRTEIYGLLQHKNYLQGEPNVLAWRLMAMHFLAKDPSLASHLRLGYAVSQDVASDGKSGFVTGEATLGGAAPLGGSFSLDLSLSYVRYFFDRRVDPFLPLGGEGDRRDNQYRAAAQIIYRHSDGWQMVLGYSYTLNNSDIRTDSDFEPYDFRRNVIYLMHNWSF